jgi:hypothetical protein
LLPFPSPALCTTHSQSPQLRHPPHRHPRRSRVRLDRLVRRCAVIVFVFPYASSRTLMYACPQETAAAAVTRTARPLRSASSSSRSYTCVSLRRSRIWRATSYVV